MAAIIFLIIAVGVVKLFAPGVYRPVMGVVSGLLKGVFGLLWAKPAQRRGYVFAFWWLFGVFSLLATLGLILSMANGGLGAGGFLVIIVLWLGVLLGRKGAVRWERRQRAIRPLPGRRRHGRP